MEVSETVPPLQKILNCLLAAGIMFLLGACGNANSREIGGGYRLKKNDGDGHYVLLAPHDSGGLIIDEIGWANPIIVARASGSMYWDAIDTAHAAHMRISDEDRSRDPLYKEVKVESAEAAWESLQGQKRLW
jgi:hypothetical protein